MDTSFEQKVRERAYEIWMAAGMSDGQALDHWCAAEHDLTPPKAAAKTPAGAAAVKATAARKSSAKAKAAPMNAAAKKPGKAAQMAMN